MFRQFADLYARLYYPVSLPEEVADALGIELSSYITFQDFIHKLCQEDLKPTKLKKFMPRPQAEAAFNKAVKKEHFGSKTLISYCFNHGWLEFMLFFDKNEQLRRVYLHHQEIKQLEGFEICLK